MNKCDFTYPWYENLISLLYSNHYTITDYHEYQNHRKPCILRHDVDMDINKAAEFTSYEAEFLKKGVNKGSTYFVLLSSDFYNIIP
jgi:hypothetical protein